MIALIGIAPATSEYRLEFQIQYLSGGVDLLIIALAVFAVPEIVDLLRSGGAVAQQSLLGRGWMQGVKDAVKNWWLIIRCSGIGCLIGIVTGVGGSVVDCVAYAHSVQSSTDRSQLGKGELRGVIGPEASNNAKDGGDLVPPLLSAIPGSGGPPNPPGGM